MFSKVPVAPKVPYVFGGVRESQGEINAFGRQLFNTLYGGDLN